MVKQYDRFRINISLWVIVVQDVFRDDYGEYEAVSCARVYGTLDEFALRFVIYYCDRPELFEDYLQLAIGVGPISISRWE